MYCHLLFNVPNPTILNKSSSPTRITVTIHAKGYLLGHGGTLFDLYKICIVAVIDSSVKVISRIEYHIYYLEFRRRALQIN